MTFNFKVCSLVLIKCFMVLIIMCHYFQMESLVLILILSLFSQYVTAADDILRAEIEEAALDSKLLADELAEMLARLELDEDREDAVEAAVKGDDLKVETALQDMLDKLEGLEIVANQNADTPEFKGNLEEKIEKEVELIKTLETLETVAKEIDDVSSVKQLKTIDEMTELLQRINEKIESSVSDDEKSKSELKTSLHLNGIVGMIKSLEKVTKDLRDMQDNIDDYFEEEEEIIDSQSESDDEKGKPKTLTEFFKSTIKSGDKKEENDSNESSKSSQKSRKGKQLDNDYEDFGGDDYPTDDEAEPAVESKSASVESSGYNNDAAASDVVDLKSGSSKSGSGYSKEAKEEPAEECEETEAKSKVRVCVPKFSSVEQSVNLYSSKPEDVRHCYDV